MKINLNKFKLFLKKLKQKILSKIFELFTIHYLVDYRSTKILLNQLMEQIQLKLFVIFVEENSVENVESIYVKQKISNKTESNHPTTNEDEHSQEYISRRRDSKEEKEEKLLHLSPSKSPTKQPTFKQLTLDQFLKKIPPVKEKIVEITPEDTKPKEEITPDVNNEESRLPRRTKRLSNTAHVSKSETDLVKMANGTSEDTLKKPMGKSVTFLLSLINRFFMF